MVLERHDRGVEAHGCAGRVRVEYDHAVGPAPGANYVLHAAGWLTGGLSASFAKFVLDAGKMEMYHRLGSGVYMCDLEEALDAVREVGPGGHFLGTAHTLAKFQTAFYAPKLLDNASFEQWTADGALDANQRALRRAQEMIRGYEPPPMDEALRAYIAKREEELPEGVE